MKLESIWIVTNPNADSVIEDIVFCADLPRLQLQFAGGLDCAQLNPVIFTDECEALAHGRWLLSIRDRVARDAAEPAPKKPKVRLTGKDGNAFAVLGFLHRAATKAGWSHGRWVEFRVKATSGNYDHLLATAMEHFDVS